MAKRPRDPNQLAKQIVDIATGSVKDTVSELKRNSAPRKGHAGGVKGGKARTKKLSPARRSEIARKAADSRWQSH